MWQLTILYSKWMQIETTKLLWHFKTNTVNVKNTRVHKKKKYVWVFRFRFLKYGAYTYYRLKTTIFNY
jgi:hypothetical protein